MEKENEIKKKWSTKTAKVSTDFWKHFTNSKVGPKRKYHGIYETKKGP